MKLNIYSQTQTLAAGAQTDPIAIDGNCILLSPVTVDGYTTDIAIKIDDSGFRKVPTGTKLEMPDGETFRMIQFKNTGGTSQTFHVLALRGNAANYNLQLNGDISVAAVTISGTPNVAVPGGVAITGTPNVQPVERTAAFNSAGSATTGADSTATITSSAKSVLISCVDFPLIVKDSGGTNVLAYVGAGESVVLNVSNQDLKLRGHGGTSLYAITENQ